MDKAKHKTIFSQKLASYLMGRGFVLMDMRKDVKGTGRNVYFFKESKELINAIFDYKASNE